MSAHTPGPWTAKPAADGSGDFGIVAACARAPHGYVVVAEAFAAVERVGERNPATGHNAYLIAAAPELLDELRKAADTFEELEAALSLLGRHVLAEGCRIAKESHRTAIAKAAQS